MQKRKRMIENIILEAAKTDVVMPWARDTKHAAQTASLKTARG